MQYPKNHLAQTTIQLCKAKEIKHIIISPGSRNAPLTIGFTNDSFFECFSIVDERCAAFFALGIAQQLGKPVALVCTSGSALLNYYPAVAEAFYSDFPLVVLSADRPEHLIGIGDGQTINQKNVFNNHILYSANLIEGNQQQNEIEINTAINSAIVDKGPVHINMPFKEPLYELVNEISVEPQVISCEMNFTKINSQDLEDLLDVWNNASKKMVLAGVNQPNTIEQKWLDEFANDDSVIVFTETTSNLHQHGFFTSIDKIIAPLNNEDFKQLQPDILVTFGGLVVSKKIKAFLRTYKPKVHWHIDERKANDTFFSLSKHLKLNPNVFFSQFLPKTKASNSSYKSYWLSVKSLRQERHDDYLKSIEFSDLKVFSTLFKAIPNDIVLQLGNSSTVRYAQLFDLNKTVDVFCNRGTSGIDGSTSTAIGCAVANHKQTTLITGDLSFFYDSNALWNNYIPNNFKIIVINNQGGGIFRILPGHKGTKNFETFFETKHQLTAMQLCDMYKFDYVSAANENELNSILPSFFLEENKPKLLEVFTPSTINDTILLNYFNFIK